MENDHIPQLVYIFVVYRSGIDLVLPIKFTFTSGQNSQHKFEIQEVAWCGVVVRVSNSHARDPDLFPRMDELPLGPPKSLCSL